MIIQLGIRRSGTHAITQWLFPMLGDFIFINMNDQVGMIQPSALVQNGSFQILCSFENIPLDQFNQYAENMNKFLVVRHPLHMLASSWEVYKDDPQDRLSRITEAIQLYSDYLRFDGDIIIYDEWCSLKHYRKQIASKLGLKFDDRNFKNTWGFGISSFADKQYLNRCFQVEDEGFKKIMHENSEKLLAQFNDYKLKSNEL